MPSAPVTRSFFSNALLLAAYTLCSAAYAQDAALGEDEGGSSLPPGMGRLALALIFLLGAFTLGIFAVRTWYRNSLGLGDRTEELPAPEVRDTTSLIHVARYASEQKEALELERIARKSTESQLSQSRSQLERTMSERLQFGRELHDDTCQVLYGVTLHLDALHTALGDRAPDLQPGVARSLEQVRSLSRRVRSYVEKLESEPLPHTTWHSLLREAAAPFEQVPGLTFSTLVAPTVPAGELPASFAEDAAHIAREGIANALRHGKATEIRLHVANTDGKVRFTIRDNGSGFDPASVKRHGLLNIEDRAKRLGAEFSIVSARTDGTTLQFDWTNDTSLGSSAAAKSPPT